MSQLTRTQKIQNLEVLLVCHRSNTNSDHDITVSLTAMIGPNIEIRTEQYTGVVTVDFEGSVVRFDTYGYRHRFADSAAFMSFFEKTVESPLHAVHTLAGVVGGKTLGNSVVLNKNETAFYITEVQGGFTVASNNEKTFMSYDDIVSLLG